ncbi:hypothetical protein U1Q18_022791 [Sarracenia purpurea var. burkii]
MISKWPRPGTRNDPDLGSGDQTNQAQFGGRLQEEARSRKHTNYDSTSLREPTPTRSLSIETRKLSCWKSPNRRCQIPDLDPPWSGPVQMETSGLGSAQN